MSAAICSFDLVGGCSRRMGPRAARDVDERLQPILENENATLPRGKICQDCRRRSRSLRTVIPTVANIHAVPVEAWRKKCAGSVAAHLEGDTNELNNAPDTTAPSRLILGLA